MCLLNHFVNRNRLDEDLLPPNYDTSTSAAFIVPLRVYFRVAHPGHYLDFLFSVPSELGETQAGYINIRQTQWKPFSTVGSRFILAMRPTLIGFRHSDYFRIEDNIHLATKGFGPGKPAEETLKAGTGI